MMVHVHYDLSLVAGSVVVALVVCYFAISIEQLLFKGLRKELQKIVLLGSGATLGAAIWCMHFLGMLACDFPAAYRFDYTLTIVSYLIAFVASTFAIWLNTRPKLSLVRLVLGSFLMGLAITGMHYVGMMGLIVEGHKAHYNLLLILSSILIAISGTGFTFWLSFKYKKTVQYQRLFKFSLAISIIGMHYTGMAAVQWHPLDQVVAEGIIASQQGILLFSTIFITSLILMAAFAVAIMEQRLEERSRQLFMLNQELANQAFQDSLTKLPNRSFLTEYANSLLSNHQYHHHKLAFLYIDL
ncbi:MAG TPA: MHYT domain-containing protein, partial [Flavobacterium sp.]|nr:MHYT domain-containing protein [Flavobacterium sp.]